jgi:hypothetical protein
LKFKNFFKKSFKLKFDKMSLKLSNLIELKFKKNWKKLGKIRKWRWSRSQATSGAGQSGNGNLKACPLLGLFLWWSWACGALRTLRRPRKVKSKQRSRRRGGKKGPSKRSQQLATTSRDTRHAHTPTDAVFFIFSSTQSETISGNIGACLAWKTHCS